MIRYLQLPVSFPALAQSGTFAVCEDATAAIGQHLQVLLSCYFDTCRDDPEIIEPEGQRNKAIQRFIESREPRLENISVSSSTVTEAGNEAQQLTIKGKIRPVGISLTLTFQLEAS